MLQAGQCNSVEHFLDAICIHVADDVVWAISDESIFCHCGCSKLGVTSGVDPSVVVLHVDVNDHCVGAGGIFVVAHH